ncbi:hypothetical protein [Acinetobacter junii]|uniref:hypothetical protein n=1 Tax=Acinetobacter junii TaxID=40215 RepID=UPI00100DC902|nr:hypothetical protein [Acinetobacter junii]RXS92973.1 hypothetical protein ETZ13_14325 [Acinetobacter junii]
MSADDELVGTVVLYVNGQEIDCASVSSSEQAGRKIVPTMNSKGRANKSAHTTKSGTLQIDAYIPKEGAIDWASISGATVIAEAIDGGYREVWSGVGVVTVGKRFNLDGEATQSLECFYKDYVTE